MSTACWRPSAIARARSPASSTGSTATPPAFWWWRARALPPRNWPESFRARATRKIYWALVKGVPKPHQGRISTWLAKEGTPEGDRMRVARHGSDDASHAVSLYSVVDQAGQQLAWLSMRPVTGRTHQLRAHAAHIGHPIVGDPKYFNDAEWQLPGGIQNKLHLHARRIVIPHPAGGTLDVTAPLPPHMQQSWNLLGFDMEAGMNETDEEND